MTMEKQIILVGAQGFWSVRDLVNREVLHDRFEMIYADDFRISLKDWDRVVAIVLADQPCDGMLMGKFPSLRTIARTGTGYDNVDIRAAQERNITVTRVSALNAESVSDFALGLLLALSRNIVQAHTDMVWYSVWERRSGMLLSEMTVGLVGLGAIGCSLAKKLHALGVGRLVGWNRTYRWRVEEVVRQCRLECLTLPQVMSESDAVVVGLALTAETKRFISREMLFRMKPSAFLINISRGAVVDEEALAECVAEGRIGGAALDVFSVEPPVGFPFAQPFVQKLIESAADGGCNVILTPHNAWLTKNTVRNVSLQVARNIQKVLGGQPQEAEIV